MIRKKQKAAIEALPFPEESSNENTVVREIEAEAAAESEKVKRLSKKDILKEFEEMINLGEARRALDKKENEISKKFSLPLFRQRK